MRQYWVLVGILVFFTVLVVVPRSDVMGHDYAGHGEKGLYSSLTGEQRETVREKIREMRDRDATSEEIHAAVSGMLEGYGIEVPEHFGKRHGPGGLRHGSRGFRGEVTSEQRDAVREKIREMRDRDATSEEIHAAVSGMLEGYGIEVPEHFGERYGPGGLLYGCRGFWEELTGEQRETVREKIKEMRSEDASCEEIHAAVAEILEGCGIEVPEHFGERHGPDGLRHGSRGFRGELTGEQRDAVREKIREMRDRDATREEIRAAVAEMLEGYDIEVPEQPGGSFEKAGFSEGLSAGSDLLFESFANPNPFSEETSIAYTLSARNDVEIGIYNAAGQLMKSFEMGVQEPGSYSVQWDGTYENGAAVPSGVYLYRIEVGDQSVTRRVVLVK